MLEIIKQPWPWYVAGFIIGLTVPAILLLGNKKFGISSIWSKFSRRRNFDQIDSTNWASQKPNLLNVAITRAKYRFIAIGDKDIWHKQAYFNQLTKLNG